MTITLSVSPALLGHYLVFPTHDVPSTIGVAGDYLFATNGVYKRVHYHGLTVTIQTLVYPQVIPGLGVVTPTIAWANMAGKLPRTLLHQFLHMARTQMDSAQAAHGQPVENHAVVVNDGGILRLWSSTIWATATRVGYQLPNETILRLHSHHRMPAYFSSVDDADDTDCSVSAVLGNIDAETPTIMVRANAYGDRQRFPATTIFDAIDPCVETPHET